MLKRDLLELCLLYLMSQGDQYGYELLRRLHDVFPDVQESAIYAIPPALPGRSHGAVPGGGLRRPGQEVLPPYPGWSGPPGHPAGGLAGDAGRRRHPRSTMRKSPPHSGADFWQSFGKYFSRKGT